MGATLSRTEAPEDSRVRLRTDVFDALTADRGAKTNEARAELFGVNRSTIVRLRHGHFEASLALAMRIARKLGVNVEVLFKDAE